MENEKKWKKPEITILFSGNINEDVMVTDYSRPVENSGTPIPSEIQEP